MICLDYTEKEWEQNVLNRSTELNKLWEPISEHPVD